MTPRFTPYLLALAALAGCNAAVPKVAGHNIVLPQHAPSRQVQALESPDAATGDSGSNSAAVCKNGVAGPSTNDPATGAFTNEWDCAPGGGIAKVINEGVSDPQTGDGHYDQTTIFEDGTLKVWHFTFDTSDDFLTTTYAGNSDDGSETYSGTYTYLQFDQAHSQMHEVWNLHEGTYVTDGLVATDGTSFDGTQSFDDPNTTVSPDWTTHSITNPDGTFSQDVHFAGDGFTSDYTYAMNSDGSSDYAFTTDLDSTAAAPDFNGSYAYNADGSGEGSYTQLFDDGSTDLIHDVINSDGSVVESWSFDDVATEQSVDQEGSMTWNLDGSGEGSVTSHVVGGDAQTCDVHVSADGAQTVDNCR